MWTKDTEVLKRGSQGDLVVAVQKGLVALGYEVGPVDGIFGKQTQEAVKAFQKANHLVDDGIVGVTTGTTLERVYYEKFPPQQASDPAAAKAAAVKAAVAKGAPAAAPAKAAPAPAKAAPAAAKAPAEPKAEAKEGPRVAKEVTEFLKHTKK